MGVVYLVRVCFIQAFWHTGKHTIVAVGVGGPKQSCFLFENRLLLT